MFLSNLLINTGNNPDRPRPGRIWLHNRYRVHQRLWMAFHTEEKKKDDEHFLKPYDPQYIRQQRDCPERPELGKPCETCGKIHGRRTLDSSFLFRIDPLPGGNAMILVQSAIKPDWEYAFHNAGYMLDAPAQVKPYSPSFEVGCCLRFRLFANPVKQAHKNSKDKDGKPVGEYWTELKGAKQKRTSDIPVTDLKSWLSRRAEPEWSQRKSGKDQGPPSFGFKLHDFQVTNAGYVYVNKNGSPNSGRRVRSALYEGILEVTDADHFRETVIRGLGPGKGFGFGLLSVARAG